MNFYKNTISLILFVLSFSFSYSQDKYTALEYAEEIKFKDPKEAVQIANSILDYSNSSLDCYSYFLLADIYMILEAYDKAINSIHSIYKFSCELDELDLFYLSLLEYTIYKKLGVHSYEIEALEHLENSIKKTESTSDYQFMTWAKQVIEIAEDSLNQKEFNLELFNYEPKEIRKRVYLFISYLKLLWQNPNEDNTLKLESYIEQLEVNEEKMYYFKISSKEVSDLFQVEENEEGVELLKQIISYSEYTEYIPYIKYEVLNQLLANSNYIKNKELISKYRNMSVELSNQIHKLEMAAINSIYSYRTEKYQEDIDFLYKKQNSFKNVLWGIVWIVFVVIVGWWLRIKSQERYNNEIYQYLEKVNQTKSQPYDENDIQSLSHSIAKSSKLSDTVVSDIIKGLKQFEESGSFLDNNISLSLLSTKLEVNTKYVSEVLNSHLEESFNTYINRLRIEYIVKKLKDDPKYLEYKISYIAEVTGYSSHSSFSKAFKNITGVSPTKFITYLKKEI